MAKEVNLEIMDSKRLVDSFLKVNQDTIRHIKYDGSVTKTLKRLVVTKQNSIGILLFHKERNTLILVEQFRYPAREDNGGRIVEIVAGNIDEGESVEQTVLREVREETGYELNTIAPIGHGYSSPGILSEKLFLFYGEVNDGIKPKEGGGLDEEGEDIKIIEWSVDCAWEMLENQNISDLKTQVALQWFFLHQFSK